MRQKPNILVIGASGGVAAAFLHNLADHRHLVGGLHLLDGSAKVLKDPFIDSRLLKYEFIEKRLDLARDQAFYLGLLRDRKIDLVLDLSDLDTMPTLKATDGAGASYLCTAMSADPREKTMPQAVDEVFALRGRLTRAPHIVCSGMNPGCVNIWVRHGLERHGRPLRVVYFEFDTSRPIGEDRPVITWSIKEFFAETLFQPGGTVLGRFRTKALFPNSVAHRRSLKPILGPIMKLDSYPEGFPMFHEECLSIGNIYDLPSTFIYSVNPTTMRRIIDVHEKKRGAKIEDFQQADNSTNALDGADNIGVMLEYPGKRVYYFNSLSNTCVVGTNATYTQVITGVFAGFFALLRDRLKPGVYFPEELYHTSYPDFVFDNLRVQEYVFARRRGGLRLLSSDPLISVGGADHAGHPRVILATCRDAKR